MVAVHVRDQHDVDLAQARVGGAGDAAARIVEDARAVGVFEDEGAIQGAELAVVGPERRYLDVLGQDRRSDTRRRKSRNYRYTLVHRLPPRRCPWEIVQSIATVARGHFYRHATRLHPRNGYNG